jgi:hypothetical protein
MGGEAATMTMESRHIVDLDNRFVRRSKYEKDGGEYMEMRERPPSESDIFADRVSPRAL